MNHKYAHILYNDNEYLTPKKATFDHRTKTGFMTTWSTDQASLLLKEKYWNCLSAFGLESAMKRKISFERKHSDTNLLYFKYEMEVPDSLEGYFDMAVIGAVSSHLSIRETTEEVYKMLRDYADGSLKFNDQIISSWLGEKISSLYLENLEKGKLESALLKYVETIVSKILWNVYGGDLSRMGKDLSSMVYLYTEMLDLALTA